MSSPRFRIPPGFSEPWPALFAIVDLTMVIDPSFWIPSTRFETFPLMVESVIVTESVPQEAPPLTMPVPALSRMVESLMMTVPQTEL